MIHLQGGVRFIDFVAGGYSDDFEDRHQYTINRREGIVQYRPPTVGYIIENSYQFMLFEYICRFVDYFEQYEIFT